MRYPGFAYGSSPALSLIANGERTVNWCVEKIDTQGAGPQVVLMPTPGQKPWLTAPTIGTRGALSVNGRAFAVIGNGYYEVFSGQTLTKIGTVTQDNNLAQIVFNGLVGGQNLISSGGNAYLHTLSTGAFTQVLTNEATQIGMIDGYFLAFNQTLGKLRLSPLSDGTAWDPTQFAIRTAQPDPWKAMIVNAPDIWFLGEQLSDVWYDKGSTPFPLAARSGLSVPFGIVAPFSAAVIAGSVFWLSSNKDGVGTVVKTTGYSPQKISTGEVDTAIAGYQRTSSITDAEALVYQRAGHTFYVLRFPSANATWVYDLATGVWHERGKWNSGLGRYDVWSPRVVMQAFGQHLVGDASSGVLSTLDETFGAESDGSVIRRLRRAPVFLNEMKRIPINRFQLLFQAGQGVQVGQGSDPKFMLRASPDGGETWGRERAMNAGKAGEFGRQAYVTKLGSPRLFVPEVTVTDPVPWYLLDAYLNNAA